MRDAGHELTPRQQRAIISLLSKPTIRAAAKAAKVSEKTLYEWLREPAFKQEYRTARQVILDHSLSALGRLASDAIATLKRNLRCGVPAAEVRSALGILDKAINAHAMADLAAEVEQLRTELERVNEPRRTEDAGAAATGDRQPEGDAAKRTATAGPDTPGPDDPDADGGDDPGPVAGSLDPV